MILSSFFSKEVLVFPIISQTLYFPVSPFSVTQSNLGEYNFSINEKVPSDGKLLAKAGLKTENVELD